MPAASTAGWTGRWPLAPSSPGRAKGGPRAPSRVSAAPGPPRFPRGREVPVTLPWEWRSRGLLAPGRASRPPPPEKGAGPAAEPRNVLGFYKQRHVGLDWGAPAPCPTGTARTPPKAPPPTDLSSHPRPGRLRASPDTSGLTLAPWVSPGKGAPLAGGHSRGRRRAGAPCRPPSLTGPRCSFQTTEVRDSTGLSREAG